MLCIKCNVDKSEDSFAWKSKLKGIKNKTCKKCQKILSNAHYKANKSDYVNRRKATENAHRMWFQEFKKTLKCSKCPENHPAVLDFHHVDKNTKDKDISTMRYCSKERVLKEISKCIVLCSNCHRKLHWEENNILM